MLRIKKQSLPYQSCFCEENIWWLCHKPELATLEQLVLVISNQSRRIGMAFQQQGGAHGICVWDYHVVLLVRDHDWWVYDFDSSLPFPVPAKRYLALSFPRSLEQLYQPSFRLVRGDVYRSCFTSDRSHMRDQNGNWRSAPPDWEPIICRKEQALPLSRLLDFSAGVRFPMYTLQELREML